MKKILAILLTLLVLVPCVPCTTPVFADSDNLALNKPVHSTETMEPYLPESVNDGNLKTNWVRAGLVMNAYVGVDLLDTYTITSVVLHNRLDTSDDEPDSYIYRTNVEVRFSNDPEFKTYDAVTAMTDVDPGYGVPIVVTPPSQKPYRYVRAVKTDTIIFVLAELEVYGYQAVDDGSLPEFEDVKGTKYEGPVTLMQNLGAAEGVSENEYGVYNLMTRGAAANMIVKTFNPGYLSEGGKSPFTDVGYGSYYYNGIMAAYQLGYAKGRGDGTFGPEDHVSQKEFLTMVLRALGYEQKLINSNSYTIGMNSLTQDLKLLRKVTGRETDILNNGDAAMILYNAMLANRLNITGIMEDRVFYTQAEITTLEDIYGINLYSGVVNETGRYNLSGDVKKENSTVRVGNTKFSDPDGKLDHYLGRSVTIGVKNDDNNAVSLFWVNEAEQIVTLPARDLVRSGADISGGVIKTLDAENHIETYSLSDTVDVLHNNAPYIDYKPEELFPSAGNITLIDNNGDDAYDVLCVNEYETYYVHGSYTHDDVFTVVDGDDIEHSYNSDYLSIMMAEGYPGSASGVKKGRVVTIAKAKGGEECSIIIYSEGKTGNITEISSEGVSVDGTSYSFAYGYQPKEDLQVGAGTSVFVNADGEIIWLEDDVLKNNSGWTLAFSQRIDNQNSGLAANLRFRLFTEDGRFDNYEVMDKLKVDSVKMTKEEFAEKLEDTVYRAPFISSLLRVRLNDEKRITEIDSTHTTSAETGITFTQGLTIGTALYSISAESFWYQQEMVSPAKNYAPVFSIPYVNGTCGTSALHESLYSVQPLLNVAPDRSSQHQGLVEYMKDEDGYAACYFRQVDYAEATGGDSVTVVSQQDAPFVLVQDAVKAYVNEEEGIKISGINLVTNEEVSFVAPTSIKLVESGMIYQEQDPAQWLTSNYRINAGTLLSANESLKARYIKNIEEVRFGDILRFDLSAGTALAVERTFAYKPEGEPPVQEKDVWLSVEGTYPDFFITFNRFQLANVETLSENALTFRVANADGKKELYTRDTFKGLYHCDADREKITKGFESDLYSYMSDNYRIMVFCYSTEPSALVVYEYNKQ